MAGLYDRSSRRHLAISTFTYLANSWTIFAKVNYDPSGTQNAFSYIYSHGSQPLSNVDSIAIIRNGPVGLSGQTEGTLRVIIDTGAGNLLDATTTGTITDNEWNSVAVMAVGGNVQVLINGVREQFVANIVSLTPSTAARIGDATHGAAGEREWNGLIDDFAVFDSTFLFDDIENFTDNLIDTAFLWGDPYVRTNMHGPAAFDDLEGNETITDNSMLWGASSPTIRPAYLNVLPAAPVIPPTVSGYAYYTVA